MSSDRKIRINPYSSLYPEQANIMKECLIGTHQYVTIRSGRQTGKSYVLDRIGIMLGLTTKNSHIMWIMPSHSMCAEAIKRICLLLDEKHIEYKYKGGISTSKIIFNTGAVLEFFQSQNFDTLRGYHPDYVILDELAFFRRNAFTEAIEPYALANKDMKFISASTPQGKDEFHSLHENAKLDPELYINFRLHYSMNPNVNMKFIENKKKSLPQNAFLQEYEGEFIFGTSEVFGSFVSRQLVKSWELAPFPLKKYYYGIDWALPNGKGDSTVIAIIDDTGSVAYIEEIPQMEETMLPQYLAKIINRYDAKGYAEGNGLGAPFYAYLRKHVPDVQKFTMTNSTKREIVENFRYDLQNSDVTLPDSSLCMKLDQEMSMYQMSRTAGGLITYSHAKGMHDDHLDAVMLANHARRKNLGERGIEVVNVPIVSTRDAEDHYRERVEYELIDNDSSMFDESHEGVTFF